MIRLILCLILLSIPARAEIPAGHDDPKFQESLAAWLADDPDATCPLYGLIENDNVAAAIFYIGIRDTALVRDDSRCDLAGVSTYLNSYWREDLSERSSMFNTWGAWERSASTLERLIELGEPRRAFRKLSDWATWPMPDDPALPSLWRTVAPDRNLDLSGDFHHAVLSTYLFRGSEKDFAAEAWQNWILAACQGLPDAPDLFLLLAAFCFPEDQDAAELFHHTFFNTGQAKTPNYYTDVLQHWLETGSETAPYRAVCEETCGAAAGLCLMPLFNFAGGGMQFSGMQTPSELLIDQRRYMGSESAAGGFWRSLRTTIGYLPSWISKLRQEAPEASCLADGLEGGETRWDRPPGRD